MIIVGVVVVVVVLTCQILSKMCKVCDFIVKFIHIVRSLFNTINFSPLFFFIFFLFFLLALNYIIRLRSYAYLCFIHIISLMYFLSIERNAYKRGDRAWSGYTRYVRWKKKCFKKLSRSLYIFYFHWIHNFCLCDVASCLAFCYCFTVFPHS